jgi:ABC-type multidrug transport system permease subunit
MSSLHRHLGVTLLQPDALAALCSSFVILLTFLSGGFVLSKGSTHPWTIWLYWATPLSYAQNALSINEFAVCHSDSLSFTRPYRVRSAV